MKLYETIASEYIRIFPSSQEKVDFIENAMEGFGGKSINILDIGCASGELLSQISKADRSLIGIDPDGAMIDAAVELLAESKNVELLQKSMLEYLSGSRTNHFDLQLCLGNTLAYLRSEEELESFLRFACHSLKEGGQLIIQLLNYENPSFIPGFQFPPVETERLTFKRAYKESGQDQILDFVTSVEDKDTGESDRDVHKHSTFVSKDIKAIALEKGFSQVEIYGSYEKKVSETSDFFHLLILKK